MKLGKYASEMDVKTMSDEYLQFEYNNLISDQVVANAVMAVLLKLEIERRITETLLAERQTYEMMNRED